jgi:hypothetical protein
VQYCIDDSGSYGDQYYEKANQLMAQAITKRAAPGQRGATIYITLITENTVASDSATGQSIIIDPVANAPALTPTPTPDTSNPFNNANPHAHATATAIVKHIQEANRAASQTQQAQLAKATQEARDGAHLLTTMPRQPSNLSDVYGCLIVASDHFSHAQPGASKVLIIASDLRDNVGNDTVPRSLEGVTVKALYVPCDQAQQCASTKTTWQTEFQRDHAAKWTFYDPSSTSATLSGDTLFS